MTLPKIKFAGAMLVLLVGWAGAAAAAEPAFGAEELARMNWPDLERIYRALEPGPMPNGFARGHVMYCQDARLAGVKTCLSQLVWKGKHFCAAEGSLINQWCGV